MYEMAKKAREAMKSKAKRLAGEKDGKVDSSNWSPSEPLNADVKTGMRPISKRAYKAGGKVAGVVCAPRADRKPRKAGGRAITADSLINRDQKDANESREGKKHIGGMKKGGRTGKALGGRPTADLPANINPAALIKAVTGPTMGFKKGGKARKAMGGQLDPAMIERAPPMPEGRRAPAPAPAGRGAPISPRMLAMLKAKLAGGRNAPPAAPPQGSMPVLKKGGKAVKKDVGGPVASDPIGDLIKSLPAAKPAAAAPPVVKLSPPAAPPGDVSAADVSAADAARMRAAVKAKKAADAAAARLKAEKEDPRNQNRGGRAKHKSGGKAVKKDVGGAMSSYGAPSFPQGSGPNPNSIVGKNAMNFGMGASGSPYKKGGMAKHEDASMDKALIKKMVKPSARTAKFGGGALSDAPKKSSKGKTNINIIINPGEKQPDAMAGAPGMPPGGPARPPGGGVPVPMSMPSGGAPPMPMPMPMPPPPAPVGMPPMGRKAGGKVYRSYKDLDAGAGSGSGRLEKTMIQKARA